MTGNEKAAVLLTAAEAYLRRGKWIQYDQLSMDRIVRCTPRRNALAPPEAGTPQSILFLDCSSFVWSCYHQAFGHMLEADLTWHMIDRVQPRVFCYELTHSESAEEAESLLARVRRAIRPGDVITLERMNGTGHTLLCMGEDRYMHCTQARGFNGYDYENRRNVFDPEGGMRISRLDDLLELRAGDKVNESCLMHQTIKRFSLSRPLDMCGEPTEDAAARCADARDLVCGVTVSPGPGHCAFEGDDIVYALDIRNVSASMRKVRAEFIPCAGMLFKGKVLEREIGGGESARFEFHAAASGRELSGNVPVIRANGLGISVPHVLFGAAGSCACGAGGKDVAEIMRRLFFLHDTLAGDVLSRRRQKPSEDMCVYGLFGGFGVMTPSLSGGMPERIACISADCLERGDVIAVSDDALFSQVCCCRWTGDGLEGRFEPSRGFELLGRAASEDFIDSLFGRFCFAVLRPSLAGLAGLDVS